MDDPVMSNLGEIPNPFTVHKECFHDLDLATLAIRGTLRRIFGDHLNDDDPLALRGVKTMFKDNPELDLEFDYKKRIVIFWFQTPSGNNSHEQMLEIRNQIRMEYGKSFSDFNARLGMTVFHSLKKEAKKEVIKQEKEREDKEKKERKKEK